MIASDLVSIIYELVTAKTNGITDSDTGLIGDSIRQLNTTKYIAARALFFWTSGQSHTQKSSKNLQSDAPSTRCVPRSMN
jgi:hypothetical protein